MQDLDNYRREEEIKRLKDRTEDAEKSEEDSNHLSVSPSSPRLRGYLDSNVIETDKYLGKNSGTHSHDSLLKK